MWWRNTERTEVAQIITFGTMAARAVIRDVGRALDMPYGDVDIIAKMIPFQPGMSIDKALELNPELKQQYEEDEKVRELINTARLLEGMPRHASTHARKRGNIQNPLRNMFLCKRVKAALQPSLPWGFWRNWGFKNGFWA